jgi:hypothetical protein
VIDVHLALTLRATRVTALALRAIQSVRPILGLPNGETTGFEEALESLRSLYLPPKERAPRAPRRPRAKRPPRPKVAARAPLVRPRLAPEPELDVAEQESPWDPEPVYEASRCQALLMEIIRRAAHDWVLYRQHHRLELKMLAEQAFVWLFEEEPGHPAWRDRERALFKVEPEGSAGQTLVEVGSRRLTSFLSICEACGLDPEAVRERAREMTVESIMHTGRHIERRKPRGNADSMSIESHSVVVDVDLDALDAENSTGSHDYYDNRSGYGADNGW